MDLDQENLSLIDPHDLTVLNVQPIKSIRVWGVGRDNGRLAILCSNLFGCIVSSKFAADVKQVGTLILHKIYITVLKYSF